MINLTQDNVGKWFKTRLGKEAVVLTADRPCEYEPIVMMMKDGTVFFCRKTGKVGRTDMDHSYDLIAEWVEPKRIKGWVNVYKTNRGFYMGVDIHRSKEEARRNSAGSCIACIEIDCLEGEGL